MCQVSCAERRFGIREHFPRATMAQMADFLGHTRNDILQIGPIRVCRDNQRPFWDSPAWVSEKKKMLTTHGGDLDYSANFAPGMKLKLSIHSNPVLTIRENKQRNK